MSRFEVPTFNPVTTMAGSFNNPLGQNFGAIVIINDSPAQLIFTFEDGQPLRVPYQTVYLYRFSAPCPVISWAVELLAPSASSVINSVVSCEVYSQSEQIDGVYPYALVRSVNVGGTIVTASSAVVQSKVGVVILTTASHTIISYTSPVNAVGSMLRIAGSFQQANAGNEKIQVQVSYVSGDTGAPVTANLYAGPQEAAPFLLDGSTNIAPGYYAIMDDVLHVNSASLVTVSYRIAAGTGPLGDVVSMTLELLV